MSDVMFYGVLRMPQHLAMANPLSRAQFYAGAQEAVNRVEAADKRIAELESAIEDVKGALVNEEYELASEIVYRCCPAPEPTKEEWMEAMLIIDEEAIKRGEIDIDFGPGTDGIFDDEDD